MLDVMAEPPVSLPRADRPYTKHEYGFSSNANAASSMMASAK